MTVAHSVSSVPIPPCHENKRNPAVAKALVYHLHFCLDLTALLQPLAWFPILFTSPTPEF